MSHLAIALSQLLTEQKKTAAAVSQASGIPEAQLSRIRNGRQVWVSTEDLIRIATGICPDTEANVTKAHARLLHARLQDDHIGPGAQFVRLELLTDTTQAMPVTSRQPILPPKAKANLDIIASRLATDQHVREMVETAANYCRRQLLPKVRLKTGFHAL